MPAQGRLYFTRGGIVKSNVAAGITGCEDVAVWTEAHAQYTSFTGQRRPDLGARFCVPNPNQKFPVSPTFFPQPPTTTYFCAARRETHRPDGVVVPAQRALAGARFHRRTVVSLLHEAMTVPWAEKATELTVSLYNHSNNQYSLYLLY